VLTDCFLVPFDDIAAFSVSYRAMYKRFRETRLPPAGSRRIPVNLPVLRPPELTRGRAMRAVELLLTNKPVCVLGADGVGIDQRLEFFDSVMTMLPYGMRGRLAAATLTKSNFYEHKFRLFFSSAPRPGDDCQMDWGSRSSEARRPDEAKAYINWLTSDLNNRVPLLAGLAEPTGFSQSEVSLALKHLQESQGRLGRHDIPFTPQQVYSTSSDGSGQYTPVIGKPRRVRQRRPRKRDRGERGAGMASPTTSLVRDGDAGRRDTGPAGASVTKSRSSHVPASSTIHHQDPLYRKWSVIVTVLLLVVACVAVGFIVASLN
jgi:hypothetical protein